MDFVRALKILRARKWTILAVSILGLAVVAMAPQPQVQFIPSYMSKAKVLITPPNSSVRAYGGASAASTVDFSWFSDPTVLTELLRSEELLERVIEQAQTSMDKQQLAFSISVEPLSNGRAGVRLFNLTVQNPDPLVAQKLTRLVTNEFVKYVEDLSAREFANTRRFIEELVVEAEGRRDAVETALMAVREKYLTGRTDDEIRMQVSSIEARMNEAEREITTLQGEVASLKEYLDGVTSSPPWAVVADGEGSLSTLSANVAEKQLELVRVREIYTDSNENVKEAERKLASAQRIYREALQETVTSLYKSKASKLSQVQGLRSSLISETNSLLKARMNDEDRRLVAKYERELQVWEQNHLNLQQQLYQARVVEQSSRRSGSVNVLEQPGVGVAAPNSQKAPVTKSKMKRITASIPFCLILGIAAAFAQEYLRSSTKLRPRIEEALELPVLAVIPATPSELTVDWESFKRPGRESISPLVLASHRGSGFEERRGAAKQEVLAKGDDKDNGSNNDSGSGFGGNFRFRNQK